jgi:hypothetical protein
MRQYLRYWQPTYAFNLTSVARNVKQDSDAIVLGLMIVSGASIQSLSRSIRAFPDCVLDR